ncbi:hypothetical protein TNCV_1577661 [Trichonephila clavipes]|nr:hypothetical protein TNCV_1577661 [Trichonephila clavipes]
MRAKAYRVRFIFHDQMLHSGGQSDVKPPLFSLQVGLVLIYRPPERQPTESALPSAEFEPQTCDMEKRYATTQPLGFQNKMQLHQKMNIKQFPWKVTQSPPCDEAHFWLNGYVNKQNYRIWSVANPQVYVETPLHPEKLTVWCALWAGGILLQKR